jgi:hypothetical protein
MCNTYRYNMKLPWRIMVSLNTLLWHNCVQHVHQPMHVQQPWNGRIEEINHGPQIKVDPDLFSVDSRHLEASSAVSTLQSCVYSKNFQYPQQCLTSSNVSNTLESASSLTDPTSKFSIRLTILKINYGGRPTLVPWS